MAAGDSATTTDSAPAVLHRLIHGYQFTQALYVATRLGLPDFLADGPRAAPELAVQCDVHPPSLTRLLRALTTVGVFAEVEPDVFGPTPLSELLRRGAPDSRRAWLLLVGADLYQSWDYLLQSIRTGETTRQHRYGTDSWAWRARNPELNAIFNDAMAEEASRRVAALVEAYDFASFNTVIDVGGGRGALLAGILRAHPDVHGVLFDQPHVIEGAEAVFAAAGVADRASIVAGDFFASVPTGGDAYILSMILHDWDDERATAILRICHQAMAGHGTLLLVERVLPTGPNREWEPYFSDLNMLQGPGGRERTAAEWRALLGAARFTMTRVVPTAAGPSLIEALPA